MHKLDDIVLTDDEAAVMVYLLNVDARYGDPLKDIDYMEHEWAGEPYDALASLQEKVKTWGPK